MDWRAMLVCARRLVLVAILPLGCGDDAVPADGGDSASTGAPAPDSDSTDTSGADASTSPGGTQSSDDAVDDTGSSSDEGTTTGAPEIDPEPAGDGVAAGFAFSCGVRDGVLTCWGNGGCGQLGDGTDYGKPPVAIATDRVWTSVATGFEHACAIEDGGALWCWGDGLNGKVGDGSFDEFPFTLNCRREPVEIDPGTAWTRVALGNDHTCGVQVDGTMWCWGSNESAQIGDGSVGPLYTRVEPTQVVGDDWIDVFAGDRHSCGLRSDGSVWCWGVGPSLASRELVFSSTPVLVEIPATIWALGRSGGSEHTCAIDDGDSLWCWGSGGLGQIGREVESSPPIELDLGGPIAEVATRSSTTCARRTDGTVLCFGAGSSGQLGDGVAEPGHRSSTPITVPLPSSATSITIGGTHACARTDDGIDHCWGDNDAGQIGDGTSGPDNARLVPAVAVPWGGGPVAQGFTSLSIGSSSGCGVRSGELSCWGGRRHGALGNDDPADDCSAANPFECAVTTPVSVVAPGAWTSISVGDLYACAIASGGTLWCWGTGGSGQLGSPGEEALVPVQVESAQDWSMVSAGGTTTCGIRSPGTLWCWGSNATGQLGNGSLGGLAPAPAQVGSDADWIRVVADREHVCGIRNGDELWCWGDNDFGELGQGVIGDPNPTPTLVAGSWAAVALSDRHTCAIASTGALSCWGSNDASQVGAGAPDPSPAPVQLGTDTDWVALGLGTSSSCGVRIDGTAWCWGSNHSGQIGNGLVERETIVPNPTMVVGPDDFVALTGRDDTICGLGADGTGWCWGANQLGRKGNDTIFISGSPTEVRDDG